MRFGVAFIPGMPYRRVVELAREAEALGFDELYIPDQTFHRDPFALLALCADATERIRLGMAVTNPYTRHPVQIARGAGLVAEVSQGRFVLGIGAGNRPRVLAGMGFEQTKVVQRLREAVDVIRRLLAGETVDYESETLTVRDVSLDFDPGADVPILIGSRGPKVLSLAGEVADYAMLEGLFTPTALDWARARVAEGADAAGRAGSPPLVSWQALVLGDDDLAEQREWKRWASLLIKTTRRPVLERIGVSEESIRWVAEAPPAPGGAGEPSGEGVRPDDVSKLLLVGSPAQVLTRVTELRNRGVAAIACTLFGEPEEIAATMRRFAQQVMDPARS